MATVTNQTTIIGYIDTEVNSIKTVTDKLDDTLEDDGGTYRFTANALEEAPSGSGGDATEAKQDQIIATLGTPADTDLATDIASIQTDTTTLLARITSTLFSGITSLAQWLGAMTGKQVANTTALTEIKATGAGSGTYSETTDSLEAVRDNMGTAQTGDSYVIVNSGTFGNSALKTLIDAVPTAAEIDTQLTSSHGSGSWASASLGAGARTITITVDDDTNPLENAKVRATEGINSYVGTTDENGEIVFNLDDATYTIAITKSGYSFSGTTEAIDQDESFTYSMTQVSITPPSDPSLCTFATYLFRNGSAVQGGTFEANLIGTNNSSDGIVLSKKVVSATTDANGYAELELVRLDAITDGSGIYRIIVKDSDGTVCTDVKITIPNVSTALLEDYL